MACFVPGCRLDHDASLITAGTATSSFTPINTLTTGDGHGGIRSGIGTQIYWSVRDFGEHGWKLGPTSIKEKSMPLKVGDRVRAIAPFDENTTLMGVTGTVRHIQESTEDSIGVEFDMDFPHGHDLDGILSNNRGRWGEEDALELINDNPKPMIKSVSKMMKKLLDGDTQSLVKAGYINGDLELTSEGKTALWGILFDLHKAALVEDADTVIAEAEKENKN